MVRIFVLAVLILVAGCSQETIEQMEKRNALLKERAELEAKNGPLADFQNLFAKKKETPEEKEAREALEAKRKEDAAEAAAKKEIEDLQKEELKKQEAKKVKEAVEKEEKDRWLKQAETEIDNFLARRLAIFDGNIEKRRQKLEKDLKVGYFAGYETVETKKGVVQGNVIKPFSEKEKEAKRAKFKEDTKKEREDFQESEKKWKEFLLQGDRSLIEAVIGRKQLMNR